MTVSNIARYIEGRDTHTKNRTRDMCINFASTYLGIAPLLPSCQQQPSTQP